MGDSVSCADFFVSEVAKSLPGVRSSKGRLYCTPHLLFHFQRESLIAQLTSFECDILLFKIKAILIIMEWIESPKLYKKAFFMRVRDTAVTEMWRYKYYDHISY